MRVSLSRGKINTDSMKSFKESVLDEGLLTEKQIIINNGKPYGQVVYLIGGSASGKGFARTHFLESEKFRLRDVDEWKRIYLKLANEFEAFKNLPPCEIDPVTYKPIRTGKCNPYGKLKNLDMSNPVHVLILHKFITNMNIKRTSLHYLLSNATPGRLPNILFDITLQNGLFGLKELTAAGYKPEDIHIVWVLTNFDIAVERNRSRNRRVPDDVVLITHEASALNMIEYIRNGFPPLFNGSVYVILNNQEETKFYKDTNVISDFKYLKIKNVGSPNVLNKDLVMSWIKKNIPRTGSTLAAQIDD